MLILKRMKSSKPINKKKIASLSLMRNMLILKTKSEVCYPHVNLVKLSEEILLSVLLCMLAQKC